MPDDDLHRHVGGKDVLDHLARAGLVEVPGHDHLGRRGQRLLDGRPGLLGPARRGHPGVVDPVHLAGQPATGRGGVVQPARGEPPVVVAALLTALGLAVADDDQESRRAVHAHIVPCAAATSTLAPVPLRPVSPVPAGILCVIGGAEDRTGSRVVLREFVRLAGGDGCRIAVVATASSLGQEILDSYDVVFRELGAGDVLRLRPESRRTRTTRRSRPGSATSTPCS